MSAKTFLKESKLKIIENICFIYKTKFLYKKIFMFFTLFFIVFSTSFLMREAILHSKEAKWDLIPSFININIVQNTGIAFSGFSQTSPVFVYFIQSIPIVIGFFVFIFSKSINLDVALCLLMFGGLSNVIDRALVDNYANNNYLNTLETVNAVVDYFEFDKTFIKNFAVFNFPDIYISVGVVYLVSMVIYFSIKDYKKEKLK